MNIQFKSKTHKNILAKWNFFEIVLENRLFLLFNRLPSNG